MSNLSKEFEQKARGKLKLKRRKAISWVCMIAMIVSIFAVIPPIDAEASTTTYTVKFNANGGTGTMADQIIVNLS